MAKKFDAKAKAKRQKIIAAVLGVLLLGVLAYEVPSLMKSMNKKPPAPTTAAAPTPGPPIAGGPVTAAPAAALAPVTTLSDSDPAVQAGSGQLLSFDRFSTKDPFVQQVDAKVCNTDPTTSDAPTCVTGAARPPAGKLKATQPKKQSTTPAIPTPTQATPAPTTARISVNGTRELVDVGKTFPSSDPVFRLVSLMRTTAKIGIAGGSLSTGGATTTLTKGKKVTLMNTADGTRYELVLVAVF
ncbi:MAG TPA: hypothetical protein VK488_02650 [Gaiellaceae bacterium]|nr:hypothetical protein [Gaiellaceae bacterium]